MNPPNGITVLPNGQWVVTDDTHLSLWAQQKGHIVTDPNLFKWLRPHLAHVKRILDIGANIGDHTRQYLDWGMEVVAIEPNPLAFACLTHNCPEAVCLNAAASDTEGEPLRFMRLDNVGASRIHPDGDILVKPIILDGKHLGKFDYVKIDVEGWEIPAIRGLEQTIRECKPLIYCEVNAGALEGNGFTPNDLIKVVAAMGYTIDRLYPPNAGMNDPQFDILFRPL